MLSKPKKLSFADIEKYRLPIYKKSGKEAYVYFYVLDPDSVMDGTPRLKRIRKKFNSYSSKKERDEAALRFRDEISTKLRQGWNPLISNSSRKGYTLFNDALNAYERYLSKMGKDDVLKSKTLYDYLSRLKQLREYAALRAGTITYIYQFDKSYIESFLEYIYIGRDTSPRTRNNYLRWVSSLCTYLCDKGFLLSNYAEKIQLLREGDKKRKPLNSKDIGKLYEYLEEHDHYFLLACEIHYYTLIRPGEMSFIKIGDISLKEQTIFISKEVSKNRKDGKVTLPSKVIRLMLELKVFDQPSNFFLFGRGFKPNEQHADARIFREEWAKVRKALDFPESYQFYSLKDTGITDTIDKIGLSIAKDQARHASVATTNKYVRKEQLTAHAELKNFEGNL